MSETEVEIKKLELKYSFYKFILGTFLISLLALFANHQIQSTQIILKEKELQREYVSKFINQALDSNVEKRYQFAHYFYRLIGENWEPYFRDVEKQMIEYKLALEEKQKTFISQKNEIDHLLASASSSSILASLSKKLESIELLQQELAILQQQVIPINQSITEPLREGWMYVGRRTNSGWIERTIVEEDMPQIGDVLTLRTKTYLRDEKPTRLLSAAGFVLGKKIKVLPEKQKVHVQEIWQNVLNGAIWANVSVLEDNL